MITNEKLKATQTKTINQRLEYLRRELRAERISYGELFELQSLAGHIAKGDVEYDYAPPAGFAGGKRGLMPPDLKKQLRSKINSALANLAAVRKEVL